MILGSVVLVVVAGVVSVVALYSFREHPGPKSVRQAVAGFGSSGSSRTPAGLPYPPPAAGVYTLRGSGGERISFPPNSQNDGNVMPVSVHFLADRCWRWHVDYNVAHWEEIDFCPSGSGLQMAADRIWQSWDFGVAHVTNTAVITCRPRPVVLSPQPVAGDRARWVCHGTNTAAHGGTTTVTTAQIVGRPTLTIGRSKVPTIEQAQQTTTTGAQSGTVHEDWWFSARTGQPLRSARQITIHSPSPIGTVTYTESGSWVVASMTPQG